MDRVSIELFMQEVLVIDTLGVSGKVSLAQASGREETERFVSLSLFHS